MKDSTEFWERRGAAIYTESDGPPGSAELIMELHGKLTPDEVQILVDRHNASLGPVPAEKVCIKATDYLGNVAYIEGTIGSHSWSCTLANGIPAFMSYAGVDHDKETETKIALSRARTPAEALLEVKKRSRGNTRQELV